MTIDSLGSLGSTTAISIAAAAAVGAVGYLWLTENAPLRLSAFVDLNEQTRILPDGSRVAACLEHDKLLPWFADDARTVSEAVRRGLRESNNGYMLGYRKKQPDGTFPYVWLTYKEVLERSENLARGLQKIGLKPGQNTRIGIFARNRPEWIICEQATYNNNSILVPIYQTLGRDACTFIVNQTALEIIIVDDEEKASSVVENKSECPSVKWLVVIDPVSNDLKERAQRVGLTVLLLSDLEDKGSGIVYGDSFKLPSSNDLCCIAYTSGTSGMPKGVMITHGNIMACTAGVQFLKTVPFRAEESMISFLPLAHMFERLLETAAFMTGMRVGYFNGDVRNLLDDIKELKPTIVPVVPRVLNRLYDRVNAELDKSFAKKALFSWAMSSKKADVKKGLLRNTIWDKLVFRKIREGMGGRVKMMITGSAPLSGEVLEFTRIVMGCVVLEGYGQTECVAECTLSVEADSSTGCVGIPVPCNRIKLVDVPELGYYSKEKAGEVCIKGYNVFQGYFKNEELTKEALDEDGWLHTGDIGRWTEQGTLKIVDRKKNIFKLAQGEYVAPEKVEAVYMRSGYIAQVFVHGESLKTCTIAVVVPDAVALTRLAEELHLSSVSFEALCRNAEVKKALLAKMTEVGKSAGLCSFEQAKDIYLCAEPFTVESDLLTPTFKNKRNKLKERFAKELAAMYSKIS